MKALFAAAVAVAGCFLVSCGPAPKPLASTPPAQGLKVAGTTWGDGILLKKFTFPSDIYRAKEEDPEGYYYHPQEQVQVFDSGLRYGTKGGVYWKNGDARPQYVFFKPPFGSRYTKLRKDDLQAEPVR